MPRLIQSLVLCLLVSAFSSHAGDKVWIGANGSGWNTAGNWSPTGIPGAGDTVIFNAATNTNSVINAVFNVGAMRIESGYTVTISISATTSSLRVNGLSGTAGYSQADGIVDLSAGTAINEFQNTFTMTGGTFKTSATATENNFNNVLINGGIFDASNATGSVSINNFTQNSGGTIAKPGLNFGVNGSWTLTGGAFDPNGGTVTFSPNSPSTINAGGTTGAFNNVVYIAENNMTLASTDIVINGTFTQTSLLGGAATFHTNGRNFTVNSGASPILAGVFFADGGTVSFGAVRLAGTSHLINNTPVNGELRAGTGTVNVGDLQFEGSTTATTGVGIWTLGTGQFNISGNYNRANGGTAWPPIFNRGTNTVNFVQDTGGVQLLNAGTSPTPSATDGRFHNINKSGVSTLRLGQPLTIINNLTNSGAMDTTAGAALTVGGIYQSNSGFIDSTAQAATFNGSTVLNGGGVNGVRIANSLTITAPTTTTPGTIELIPTGGAPLPITVADGVTWTTDYSITGANYRKEGPGTLLFRSLNVLAAPGTNEVNAGSFISEFSASIGGTTLQINSGGTFGGRGTAPSISVASGGIFFPGGPTSGQLITSGSLTLAEGATFRSRIVSAAAADIGKLTVNQPVTLGNATLNLQVSGLTPTLGNKYIIIDNTSANPINGTFAGLPEGGKFGFDNRTFTISYVGGTGNDVELTSIANTSPSITSAASAVPQLTNVNQSIAFSVAATDPENSALTYSWNFADGTTGTGASVSHTYTAAGTYSAVVTVNDGEFSVTSSVTVTVLPKNNTTSLVGQGADADGDGFSDAIETAVGSDPNNPTSTPTGSLANVNTIGALTLDKVNIKLNFAKSASDSISFAGTLAVPADFVVANQKVVIDAGGVAKTLTLSEKGSVKTGGDSFKIAIKAKKKVVAAQTSKFSAAFTKGTFSSQLADENLTGAADVKNADTSVLFTIIFNNTIVQKSQPLKYSAKTGKTGAAK